MNINLYWLTCILSSVRRICLRCVDSTIDDTNCPHRFADLSWTNRLTRCYLFTPKKPRSAIALDATNPVFYCNRAAALSRLSDYQAAADDCRMSLRYDPNYSKAYGRLGIAYSKLERHDLARDAYATAIRLDPDNADYQNNMAVTQQRLTEVAAAAAAAAASAQRPAGGAGGTAPFGGLPGNFPDLSNLDLGAALANPDLMNMAQRMMTDPAMADIMQSLQAGGGMESLMDA